MASVDVPVVPIVIENYQENLGVSAGWNIGLNRAIELGVDKVVISNDDVVLGPSAIPLMLDGLYNYDLVTAHNTRDGMYPEGFRMSYVDGPDYSCFAVKPHQFVEKFGYFDENFTPAYFEDNDMAYRIELAGGVQKKSTLAKMHHKGSVTQNWGGVPYVNHEMFDANRDYYVQKWGGVPGQERFKKPFNNENKTHKDW